MGVQHYELDAMLEKPMRDWLTGRGYRVGRRPFDVGVDLVTTHEDGTVAAVDFHPSLSYSDIPPPEALRPRFHGARVWADRHFNQDGPFLRIVGTTAVPPQALLDRFEEHGIGVVHVDPDTGAVKEVVKPKDSREL